MNRNNIYTVNPLYNGSTTQATGDDSVQSGGTTIIYQQGGGTGLTDAQKQKLDGIQEGAEVNQNAYSKVRLNGSDTLIIEAKNKTDILNMSGVYPIAIAINGNGGLDFTVSSDQSNTNSVVTQSQLKAAIDQLEKDKYWKVDADGKLYTELDVYSHKEISAYGAGTGGGSTGGAGALYECADVLRDGDKVKGAEVGSVLSYNGTHWYAIPQSAIVPDLSGYATKSYVSQEINDLIGGAPGTLDTLKEIAEALGNDPNFATTITNMINNIGLRVDDIETRVISLEDMFEWDKSASASDSSLWRIKAKRDLFGVGEISAYGYSAGTVPTGAQYLYELKDVQLTDLATGQLLQYNGSKWINIDKNAVGLNETELAKYLTNNNYAKKSDITWANLLNKPTTWGWANITGKPTTLTGYGITDAVISSRQVLAGNGLTGGGALTSNVTLSLNTIGTAGTYTKITTDQYGRVVSGTILSEGDIPTLQISKISGLQSALNSKLNISDFNTWFTIKKDSQGRIVSIQANYDFFSVGEISAYGLGETQPSVTTLAGLDDVTITSPANGQTLIYDSATSQWKNGTIIGGGNISLNGTVYKPVNGVITLPNLKPAEPTWFSLSNGNSGNVQVRTIGRTGYYEFWDTGAGWAFLAAKGYKTLGGTSSQFLKADGSVDSNLYALAYGGDQNSIQYSSKSNYLRVIDRRNDTILPTSYDNYSISGLFHMSGMPSSNWWSGIHVKGWGEGYVTWELVGPSSTDNTNNRLYYRDGKGSSWATDWKGIAFLEDCNKVATPYFEGQNIYSDYGWWVVALCKLSPADSEYNYASGTMFYRRGNGIYGNGSVNFSVMKKYSTTNVYAGVIYNGFGVSTDEDAPKLCTFTYGGVKYCGLKWTGAASLDNIKTLIYDISSTGLPFYVKYFNSQSGEVFNAEIKNSIVELGSDIILYNVSTPCGLFTSANKGLEIKAKDNAWAFTRYNTNGRIVDTGLSGTTAGFAGQAGNYEIRPGANNNEGVFVRYSGSSYGKFAVVNRSGSECSIGYYNNVNPTGDKPIWTVGAGIRNPHSFDWWYHNQGYKATLDSEGKLFINVRGQGNPSCSLAIGDYDTGLSWVSDGVIGFRSNAKDVGFWGYTNGRLFNCYFREPSGNSYDVASLMINGNGSTISPSIGFHQPGVVGCNLRIDNGGNFLFEDASNYKSVYAYNFVAAGWLYSTANSCEVRIGSQNAYYVHITNNKSRPYYMDNRLDISGHVIPYSANIYDLGEPGKPWRQAYINNMHGSADASGMLNTAYIGGQQPNPQTYFNNTTGLKVAMTGVSTNGAYWSDTIWINGYHGDDVPKCTALHFPRDGSAEMYISSQEAKSTSYGAVYRIWSSRNSNKSDAAWSCSTLNASGRIYAGSVIPCTNLGHDLGVTEKRWRKAYIDKVIGGANWADYTTNAYLGGQQPNPQTYFGNTSMGLRVAMTGVSTNGAYWSDTIWINGYYGTDVPSCNALHFPRDGSSEMYISSQTYNATSYGTRYRIWSSKNSNKSDAAWSCSTLNASGRIYAGSYIETHGGLVCAGVGNSGGATGFNVYGSFYGNASHGGIEIGASDNVLGIGVHSNDSWYIWWTNSGSIGSSSNKSYIFSYNGSSWNFTGSVVASGEVTAYSDARLKSNIHTLDYRGRLIPRHYVKDGKQSIGFIAQEVQTLYPELVLGQDQSRPYLSLNYNGCTAVLSAQLNHVEDEVTMLKNKVRELEIKVSVLTEQLHSQAI